MGYYHQDDRDRAAAMGCMGVFFAFVVCLLFIVAALVWVYMP